MSTARLMSGFSAFDSYVVESFSSSMVVPEEFICKICTKIITNPQTIGCGHSFCNACIRLPDQEYVECPLCHIQGSISVLDPDEELSNKVTEYLNQSRVSSDEFYSFDPNSDIDSSCEANKLTAETTDMQYLEEAHELASLRTLAGPTHESFVRNAENHTSDLVQMLYEYLIDQRQNVKLCKLVRKALYRLRPVNESLQKLLSTLAPSYSGNAADIYLSTVQKVSPSLREMCDGLFQLQQQLSKSTSLCDELLREIQSNRLNISTESCDALVTELRGVSRNFSGKSESIFTKLHKLTDRFGDFGGAGDARNVKLNDNHLSGVKPKRKPSVLEIRDPRTGERVEFGRTISGECSSSVSEENSVPASCEYEIIPTRMPHKLKICDPVTNEVLNLNGFRKF